LPGGESDGASNGGGEPVGGAPPTGQVASPDLDVLIVIDNSIGMSIKHPLLASQVEQLVRGLVDPPCIDQLGNLVPSVNGACHAGTQKRAYAPVRSLHLGIISSSLGSLTAGSCEVPAAPDANGGARFLTRGTAGTVETEGDNGYLAYDSAVDPNPDALIQKAQDIILGTGELGCGWEMPLEAMTRFLVDPSPYDSLVEVDNYLEPFGVDQLVLSQRSAFLRPTSSVAVVLLSDENDCSIDVKNQGFLALRTEPFFRANAACQNDPESECCTSCALPVSGGCISEGCDGPNGPVYTLAEDPLSLRCWDQKRRYGVDFQYPTARYVNALSLRTIDPADAALSGSGATVQNPLFAAGRDPSQVTLLALGGVPWQDLALDAFDPSSRYRASAELELAGRWDWITGKQPEDAFMVELDRERSGLNPGTGEFVSDPNGINLGDRPIAAHDSLEYACVFPLAEPVLGSPVCEFCIGGSCSNPVCDGTVLTHGFAYPQRRQLEVARRLDGRGVAASICRQPGDASASDALIVRLSQTLAQ
jgi:hypothetical protein